jgi:hypothetical protein
MKVLRWARTVLSLLALMGAAQDAMGAGTRVAPGQEFVYSGTAEWKQSVTGHPETTISGPVQISALVTEVTPAGGYKVVLMRTAQPTLAGRTGLPPVAEVAIVRFGADWGAGPLSSRSSLSGSLGSVLRLASVPFSPRLEIPAGRKWNTLESLPELVPKPLELAYTVVGKTSVGGRNCLKVDRNVAQALPLTVDLGPLKRTLTDFHGTLDMDPATTQVVREEWQADVRQVYNEQESRLSLKLAVMLQQTRKLPAEELASRVAQAEALDKLQARVFSRRSNADTAGWADEATRMLTAFREQFPSSPYAAALPPLEKYVTSARSYAERDARLQAMKGGPAPEIQVKNLAGEEQTLGAYRGKLILLNFFASW